VSSSVLSFFSFALSFSQFVTNVLFGKLVLGKEVTNLMYGGTAVIVLGVVLTVWSASVVRICIHTRTSMPLSLSLPQSSSFRL
jgi:drug/metabolite transporter (DMT)-like permease